MHGLGNDFAIFDARRQPLILVEEQIRLIADRRLGIGCDQVIVIEESADKEADAFVRFYNADGSESGACGNGSRCVAALMFAEKPRGTLHLKTRAGDIYAQSQEDGAVSVDMGKPGLDWQDIPLAQELDTLSLPIQQGKLINPVGVSMGNPHMVFFVKPDADIDLSALGPILEQHPLFPERANVTVARVHDAQHIEAQVWERGSGLTLACGTAACATLVAAVRRGLSERYAQIRLPGGVLHIEWDARDHIIMTGAVAVAYMGMYEIPAMAGLEQAS
jgi:diaminopimelate epimerase